MLVAGAPLKLERAAVLLSCHWARLVFVRIIAHCGSVLRDLATSAAELWCVRSCTQERRVWTTPR